MSDEIVLGMLEDRFAQPDAGNGFILDGYPRNLAQANALDALLTRIGQPMDIAVQLDVDTELLVERLAGRAAAEGRADDSPEVGAQSPQRCTTSRPRRWSISTATQGKLAHASTASARWTRCSPASSKRSSARGRRLTHRGD